MTGSELKKGERSASEMPAHSLGHFPILESGRGWGRCTAWHSKKDPERSRPGLSLLRGQISGRDLAKATQRIKWQKQERKPVFNSQLILIRCLLGLWHGDQLLDSIPGPR